jgi:hypothetical protein
MFIQKRVMMLILIVFRLISCLGEMVDLSDDSINVALSNLCCTQNNLYYFFLLTLKEIRTFIKI